MRVFFLRLATITLFCTIPFQLAMASEVVLTDKKVVLDQGQLSLLEDKDGLLSLSDVRRLYSEGEFRPITGGIAEGYSSSSFWAMVRLNRPDEALTRWGISVGPAYIDSVDIYLIHQGRLIDTLAMGDQRVDLKHDLHHRLHLAGIDLPPGQTDLFIRLQTSSTSLMLMQLIPEFLIDHYIDITIYQEGLLIGVLVAILVINMLNSVWLRNMLFLHFVTYEACLIVTLLLATGLFGMFFPHFSAAELNELMQYAVVSSGFLAFIFFYGLLSFPSRLRWLVDLMFITGIAHCVWALYMTMLGQFTQALTYMNWFLVVYMILMVPVLVLQWRDVNAEQKIRIGGFLLFGFFVVANALFVSGEIGVTRHTVLVAPVMILSFQLCLHFILVASIRKSERFLSEAAQKTQYASQEAEFERRLRQSNEMFMAMFSHEIRTPLTVIDASAQAMQRMDRKALGQEDENRNKRYHRIRQSVRRISELLQLSNVFGQATPRDDPSLVWDYDLIALIHEVTAEFAGRYTNRVQFCYPEDELRVKEGVPQQALRVIIRNLIDNALKYSPAGAPVDVYVERGQYVTCITIRDHGPGLTEHVREHMFERYFRGNEESDTPGLGLGLYIVKELADRFGIELLFTSGCNGTSFACSLPSGHSGVKT